MNPARIRANEVDLQRWRLILGRFAEQRLGECGSRESRVARMDRVLDYLYGREYRGRGVRGVDGRGSGSKGDSHGVDSRLGGDAASLLSVPEWIREVRELFPNDTAEIIQRHALDRYGMTELVTDAEVLQRLEPSYELLKAVLAFKGMMQGDVLEVARQIVREDGRRSAAKAGQGRPASTLGASEQTAAQPAEGAAESRLSADRSRQPEELRPAAQTRWCWAHLHFFSRVDHHMPWHIIMAVDCSGSMMDSVIHSAVMAGIFRGLPSLRVNLVAFDTAVVDLSDSVDDPTELLMSVQLGGGTDIGGALSLLRDSGSDSDTYHRRAGDRLLRRRRIPHRMLAAIRRLCESGVKVLGLAALDAVGPAGLRSPDGRRVCGLRRGSGGTDTSEVGGMAGTSPLLKRLTDVLHGIDDEALVSLANRGLLRRAQKDLESATPTILAVETDRVRLQLSEAIVEVPELPIRSACSCPATGVCRHILAALLYLRDSVDVMESVSPEQGQQVVSAGMAESTAPELAAAGVSAETNTNKTKTAAETTAEASATDDAAQTGALVPAPADVLGNLSDEVLQK